MDELVEKAKYGDKQAFEQLILEIKQEMYLVAKIYLKSEDDIADSIQETIIICYKNIRKLRETRYFKTWAIKILINECKKINKKNLKNIVSIEAHNLENTIYASENLDNNISFDVLIKDLKEEEKIILTLFYVSGYTTKNIGKILGKNENTIKTKIQRAKNKLKNTIRKEEN